MKIFKLFKEMKAMKEVLTLIFTQNIEITHQLASVQAQLDRMESNSQPIYEEFEDEHRGDIRITKEVYNEMCEYLEEDEIELMGLT